ncbi:histidine phosphatase family protein [Paraburkholderia lacunae]|uniref:Histidine phosphatase family protein n=1 Tax=Paraburkholderia lacunae TaxID=2211104 RepID=A0A370MW87_9BURK|nr:histidine phosphatase family protein [Paraburkholderia lacunae]RDJ97643.1 histidine phosphatase family protein [Paraburkholderia lacunae]
MLTHLTLISHAATPAMRQGRFPSDDPLDARGIADASAWRQRVALDIEARALCSPALCALDTAKALGLSVQIAPELADAEYGEWRGLRLVELAGALQAEVATWTRDPHYAPPHGESFEQVRIRVGRWLDALNEAGQVIAITHACVIRAAVVYVLDAPSSSFTRIEVPPLSAIELRHSPRGWALSSTSYRGDPRIGKLT